jgi:DNA photolyase
VRWVQTSLAIFTRALRITGNPALVAAASSSAVVPAFVLDVEILSRSRTHGSRLAFPTESLADLDEGLRLSPTDRRPSGGRRRVPVRRAATAVSARRAGTGSSLSLPFLGAENPVKAYLATIDLNFNMLQPVFFARIICRPGLILTANLAAGQELLTGSIAAEPRAYR